MTIRAKSIEYVDGDTRLEGFLAYDEKANQPLPAVLIAHAWGGRDEFVCDKARDLAALGYAGFALDMYGKGVLGSGPDENAKLMQPFLNDRALLQQRITAALQTVHSLEQVDKIRIAAMGFCFGGLCVLDLARTGPPSLDGARMSRAPTSWELLASTGCSSRPATLKAITSRPRC